MSLESHSASATIAGFLFQVERVLLHLLEGKSGDVVGIETLDDVVIKDRDGNISFEQDKLTLQHNFNPITDKSKNLWNTLSIWLNVVKNGAIDINKSKFFMVTNQQNTNRSIINEISDAHEPRDVCNILNKIKDIAQEPTSSIKKFTEDFLDEANDSILCEIIKRITFIDGSTSNLTKLREDIEKSLPLPKDLLESKVQIADNLLGWIHSQCINAWNEKKQALISRDSFKRRKKQARIAEIIQISPEQFNEKKGATFVKQIQLVSDDEALSTMAINDFLRYHAEKFRLSSEGDITEQDWFDFSRNLIDRWNRISAKNRVMNPGYDEKRIGLNVLIETTDHKENLAGTQTEQQYLTTGELHTLSDGKDIGWHPRYKDLLK